MPTKTLRCRSKRGGTRSVLQLCGTGLACCAWMKRPLPLLSSCQQQAGCQTKCSQHGRALLGNGVHPQGLGAGLQVVTGVGAGMKILDYSSQIWLDPSSCLHGLG